MSDFLALFSQGDTYISLLTLTIMEIVLGIDNLIFISIIGDRLPKEQQRKARLLGLSMAVIFRILLLMCIAWIVSLTAPFLTILGHGISGRDLILIGGGLFLIGKSTLEIHHKFEAAEEKSRTTKQATFTGIVTQIVLLDIVFSFDSVITAVGLVQEIPIMVIAVIISIGIMMIFVGSIGEFIRKNPTIKMLALTFLLMIGMVLVADGWHMHVPKGYVYFAMAFSVFVEFLNLRLRRLSESLST